MSHRYIIIGAGAVGAALAAGLTDAGIPAVLISRGKTYERIREHGLLFTHSGQQRTLAVPVHPDSAELALTADDVLIFTTKTQDTLTALEGWSRRPVTLSDGQRSTAGQSLPAVTIQNGLEAERTALRYFATVIGGPALISAHHIVPGEVTVNNAPKLGEIILGPFPSTEAAPHAAQLLPDIIQDLNSANWLAQQVEDPARWKAWKLLTSASFAVSVLSGTPEELDELRAIVREEARSVLAAAGQEFADPSVELTYDRSQVRIPEANLTQLGKVSVWQSLARGSSSEVDFLNGEVVLQARLLGLQAPANAALQDLVGQTSLAGEQPGTHSARTILDRLTDRSPLELTAI